MPKQSHLHPTDLHGFSRLTVDAVAGLTDLVEAMHHNIVSTTVPLGKAPSGRTRGITGFVYRSIRGVTRLVGGGLDAVLGRLVPLFGEKQSSPEREAVLAALNGVLGDYLEASGNPLAIRMCLRRNGHALQLDNTALAAAIPDAGGKLLVLAHGLCMNDLQWKRQGHDHGAALARDLGLHACLSALQQWSPHLHQRPRVRRTARNPARHLADPDRGTGYPRPQHGRPAGAQRLALRHCSRPRLAAAAEEDRLPRHAAPWRADGARRQLDRHHPGTQSLHCARFRAWARSAAPASPTCATAICWMRTGMDATASRDQPTIT